MCLLLTPFEFPSRIYAAKTVSGLVISNSCASNPGTDNSQRMTAKTGVILPLLLGRNFMELEKLVSCLESVDGADALQFDPATESEIGLGQTGDGVGEGAAQTVQGGLLGVED